MEHITTKEAVDLLQKYDNLYATITVHHLYITLDDVIGGMMQPHLFCKPIAKKPEDKEALIKLAISGNKKVMFGSDSAPHPKASKENSNSSAGVFTAPFALPALAELFEKHDALDKLQDFVSNHAQKIYDYTPITKTVTLKKEQWEVPAMYGDVVPMFAGEKLGWRVVDFT